MTHLKEDDYSSICYSHIFSMFEPYPYLYFSFDKIIHSTTSLKYEEPIHKPLSLHHSLQNFNCYELPKFSL